jgi:hypothetical protein
MAAFTLSPPTKKAKLHSPNFDNKTRIFCSNEFNSNKLNKAVTPSLNKIDSLFKACRERNDLVAKCILNAEKEIKDGTVQLFYHRNCRSSFVSKEHIGRNVHRDVVTDVVMSENSRNTRQSYVSSFAWKDNCGCQPKKRSKW